MHPTVSVYSEYNTKWHKPCAAVSIRMTIEFLIPLFTPKLLYKIVMKIRARTQTHKQTHILARIAIENIPREMFI